MIVECSSRKLSDKFEFVGIRPLCHIRDISPFRGEKYFIKSDIKRFAPERGDVSSADRGVTCMNFIPLFILSIGQFALFCFNFFYLSTFALMPRGHILSDQSVRKYAKNAFCTRFLSRVLSRLEGGEKTAGRKRFSQSVLKAVSKRVRHSALKQENTKC